MDIIRDGDFIQARGRPYLTVIRTGGQHIVFDVNNDGQWHEVSVLLPVKGKLSALRLIPGIAPGSVEIDWIHLCKPGGTVLKAWDF